MRARTPAPRKRSSRSATGIAAAFIAALVPAALAQSAGVDTDPPVLLVLPVEPATQAGELVLRARVTDPAGVRVTTAWVAGEQAADYRPFPMEPAAGDEYVARIPRFPGRGARVAYYIEATDRQGNGPRQSGTPKTPFVARLAEATVAEVGATTSGGGWSWGRLPTTAGLVALLGLLWLIFRPRSDDREREFWLNLLAPLSDQQGPSLMLAVEQLCARSHEHPVKGFVRIECEDALYWLGVLRKTENSRLRRAKLERRVKLRQTAQAQRVMVAEARRSVAEDVFWLHLFAPLVGATDQQTEEALRELASRPHAHPIDGIRTYDRRTLRERLDWARKTNPNQVFARWSAVHQMAASGTGADLPRTAAQPPLDAQALPAATVAPARRGSGMALGKQAGFGMIEALTVVAILGIFVMASALYLKPMEAPVRTAGELVEGLIKQTRAKSMATTTAHRVRPLTESQLIVESATSCSSMAWTLDPRMDLDLPQGVALSDTTWSVCFNTRGIASDNIVLTLDHPQFEPRQLEVLKGGAVRWLP